MARTLTHVFENTQFSVRESGQFPDRIFYPKINQCGKIHVLARADFMPSFDDVAENQDLPFPKRPRPYPKDFPHELYDPDGVRFAAADIKLSDLDRYRDLRGFIRPWKLVVKGGGGTGPGYTARLKVKFSVVETVTSMSPPKLVQSKLAGSTGKFEFDLYQLGTLEIKIKGSTSQPRNGLLRAPDGTVVASNVIPFRVEVTPNMIAKSRGEANSIQKWKLEVDITNPSNCELFVDVVKTTTIPHEILAKRLTYLLGAKGQNFTLALKPIDESRMGMSFRAKSPLAETLTVHGFASQLTSSNPNTDSLNVEAEREYLLKSFSRYIEKEVLWGTETITFKVEGSIATQGATIELGRSVERSFQQYKVGGPTGITTEKIIQIPPNLPTLRITVPTTGKLTLAFLPTHSGVASITPKKIVIEIAFDFNVATGLPRVLAWVDTASLNFENISIDQSYSFSKIIREHTSDFLEKIQKGIADIIDHLLGGAFDFVSLEPHPVDFLALRYRPGKETERQPNIGYRGFGNLGIDIFGRQLGFPTDTWKSKNLDKIQHIVVLMMENRSFDHVLGHLSLGERKDVRGLSEDVLKKFNKPGAMIQPMASAGFLSRPNSSVTRLPLPVGHRVRDVIEQLKIVDGIPTMGGFVENFEKINSMGNPSNLKLTGCLPQDVLGYYRGVDLPVYDYLSKEFCVCDNYFSSHPGPTLPNRMFYLTGDFQRNRNGEPRLGNESERSFLLNRERTIFDFLNEGGVPWRVYESCPSVATLRIFSRYAFDNKNIRDIARLASDIKAGDLPPVTYIEPAMHAAPINDDHPPADMKDGQNLVLSVVNALRSNNQLWEKTLLVVTYDEHGGLFDHVVPPVAETLVDPVRIRDAKSIKGSVASSGGSYRPNESVRFGVRVPTFLVSPLVPKGSVFSGLCDHSSILKTILVKHFATRRPFMSDRVHAASDLGKALTLDAPRKVSALSGQNVTRTIPTVNARRVWLSTPAKLSAPIQEPETDYHELMAVISKSFGTLG